MNELLRRLRSRPVITGELLFGSFLVNIMAMASPLFAMQVLNRYVGQGVDATFYTLTIGVLIAIIFEFALRQSRTSLAWGISVDPDEETALKGFETLVIIDEPTESLDAEGCRAVYQALAGMAEQGRTIIVMSHDSDIVKGLHIQLDLNSKPVPKITRMG